MGDRLLLRTLAASHAAYALVTLQQSLFDPGSFESRDGAGVLISTQASQASDGAPPQSQGFLKCKLHLKQLLLAFRHAQHTESMKWNFVAQDNRMHITATVGGIESIYQSDTNKSAEDRKLHAPATRSSHIRMHSVLFVCCAAFRSRIRATFCRQTSLAPPLRRA